MVEQLFTVTLFHYPGLGCPFCFSSPWTASPQVFSVRPFGWRIREERPILPSPCEAFSQAFLVNSLRSPPFPPPPLPNNFSWDGCNTREKWNQRLCNFWGVGWANKVHYERCVSGVWAGNACTKTECAYASVPHCFLTMSEFLKLFKILQTAGYYGFKTLVNIFEKVDPLLPTLKSNSLAAYREVPKNWT